MNIHNKSNIGFIVFFILFIVTAFSGIKGVGIVSDSLNFVTTKAWDAADGAMEGTIGIQSEILAVQKRLLLELSHQDAKRIISDNKSSTDEALNRMAQSGLMDNSEISEMGDALKQFRAKTGELLTSHEDFVVTHKKVNKSITEIEAVLSKAEDQFETSLDGGGFQNIPSSEIQKYWDVADALMETRINLLHRSRLLEEVVTGVIKQEKVQAEINEALVEIKNEIKNLNESSLASEKIDLKTLPALFSKYEEQYNHSLEAFNEYHVIERDLFKVTNHLVSVIEKLEESGDAKVEEEMLLAQPTIDTATTIIYTAATIAILLTFFGYLFFNRQVITPLNKVVILLKDIGSGEGDLTVSIPENRHDELGELAKGFNQFVTKIRVMVTSLQEMVNNLKSSSEQLSAISSQTIAGIHQQQSETSQAATAMTEMSATVQEVSVSAGNAASAASDSDNEALEGKKVVANTIAEINKLETDVATASNVVNKLSEDSQNIGSVLDVIRGIAEQTNLLALNAAIEAARAGEQGRGFAVVADEVRTLAGKTQESTEEIQVMIEQIQSGVTKAVKVMDESSERAASTVAIAENAGISLQSITESISHINNMNTQIATASQEQASVTESITQNVNSINEIAQQTSNGASAITDANEQLHLLSQQVDQMIRQFKVN